MLTQFSHSIRYYYHRHHHHTPTYIYIYLLYIHWPAQYYNNSVAAACGIIHVHALLNTCRRHTYIFILFHNTVIRKLSYCVCVSVCMRTASLSPPPPEICASPATAPLYSLDGFIFFSPFENFSTLFFSLLLFMRCTRKFVF